jgi:hypothetical protein
MTISDAYSADAPLTDPAHDIFSRWPFSARIARVISQRTDTSSIVIAIYGAWGEGKTTVLNFIERELGNHTQVVVLRFNPWRFGSEDELLRGFFSQLAATLGRSLTTRREEIGEAIQKYAKPLAGIVGRSETAEGIAQLFGNADLEELRNRINRLLLEAKKRVVVLVDDIDRLERNEIYAVFRLVKLTADFANTAYVLAFDDEMVAAALQERYGTNEAGSGRAFLEKIVQVPLHLPAADPTALRQLCSIGITKALSDAQIELTEEQGREFVRHFGEVIATRLRTPRMAALYANTLAFSLPILKGEVHPVDLMLVEALRIFYPRVYSFIRENPDAVLGKAFDLNRDQEKKHQRIRDQLEKGFYGLDPEGRESAIKLLSTLFPQLNAVYGNTSYSSSPEGAWANAQRVAAREYFPRYFSYAILSGDVHDRSITEILTAVTTGDRDGIESEIRQLVTPRNAENFVQKLRRQEHTVTGPERGTLALALAKCGDVFPNPSTGIFAILNPRPQIAIMISNLIESSSASDERMKTAEMVLEAANPLGFAADCFDWLRVFDEAKPNPNAFSREEQQHLGRILADRISSSANVRHPLFHVGSERAPRLLKLWQTYGDPGVANNYVVAVLKHQPRFALDLLQSFLSTVLSAAGMFPGDFERSEYDGLASIIDPDTVHNALKMHLGSDYGEPAAYERESELSADIKLAKQFARLHAYVSTISKSEQIIEDQQINSGDES